MKIEELSPKAIEFFKKNGKNYACIAVVAAALTTPTEAIMEEHTEEYFASEMNKNPSVQVINYEVPEDVSIQNRDGEEVSFHLPADTINITSSAGNTVYNVDINNMTEEDVKNIAKTVSEELPSKAVESEVTFTVMMPWEKSKNYTNQDGPKISNREYNRLVYKIKPNETFNWDYFMNGSEVDYKKILEYYKNDDTDNIIEIVDEQVETKVVSKSEEKELILDQIAMQVDGTDLVVMVNTKSKDRDQTIKIVLLCGGLLLIVLMPGIMASKNGYPFYMGYK